MSLMVQSIVEEEDQRILTEVLEELHQRATKRLRFKYLKWVPINTGEFIRPTQFAPRGVSGCWIELVHCSIKKWDRWAVTVDGIHYGYCSRKGQAKRMAESLLAKFFRGELES